MMLDLKKRFRIISALPSVSVTTEKHGKIVAVSPRVIVPKVERREPLDNSLTLPILQGVICPRCQAERVIVTGEVFTAKSGAQLLPVSCGSESCRYSWQRFADVNETFLPHSEKVRGLWLLEGKQPIAWEPWQVTRILDPVLNHLDVGGKRIVSNALIGLPKKNTKSTTAAILSVWGLLFDDPEPEVIGVAADLDQSKIILRQAASLIRRNPQLEKELVVYRDTIARRDDMGVYRVLSSDSPSAHGFNPSLVVCDELWTFRDYSLLEAVTESPVRKQPIQFAISYAGLKQTPGYPLWDVYQRYQNGELDSKSYVFWSHKNLFSKVSEQYLATQRARLPLNSYLRLHENRWTDSSGEFLTSQEIESCVDDGLTNEAFSSTAARYFIGVDLGLVKDRTAISVCHCDKTGQVILDYLKVIQGTQEKRVSISYVEDVIIQLLKGYRRVLRVVTDAWQMESSAQRLQHSGVRVERFTFTQQVHNAIAEMWLSYVRSKRIHIPRTATTLLEELRDTHIETSSNGTLRVEHDSQSHNDAIMSTSMSALSAIEDFKLRRQRHAGGGAFAHTVTAKDESEQANDTARKERGAQ